MSEGDRTRNVFLALLVMGALSGLLILADAIRFVVMNDGIYEGDRIGHGLMKRGTGFVGLAHPALFYLIVMRRRRAKWYIIPLYIASLGLAYVCAEIGLDVIWKGEVGWGFLAVLMAIIVSFAAFVIIVGSRPMKTERK